jgi:hypothetical protein
MSEKNMRCKQILWHYNRNKSEAAVVESKTKFPLWNYAGPPRALDRSGMNFFSDQEQNPYSTEI